MEKEATDESEDRRRSPADEFCIIKNINLSDCQGVDDWCELLGRPDHQLKKGETLGCWLLEENHKTVEALHPSTLKRKSSSSDYFRI
ncbi:hypothetical protein CHARACLAT_029774 [Characodon lateralis]|uniref:Uncharacterized protein n=1 Tax=Characodon lateralis TaxID=208331 RepID=A0ABU7EE83_9TELE|nr:hypothetical protein [Characodon lateralis]